MVRTVGIDPGEHAVKVVELDGSYRKTRLLRVHTEVLTAGAVRADAVASAARTALDSGMKGEVYLGHPCREAVLRVIDLPFRGRDAIKKVVKAEVEGEIQGYSVDDMIVDFHEIGAGLEGGTRVLVASVPKEGLRSQLTALTAQSIEPEAVDLDTMALWRAADWAGAFEDLSEESARAPGHAPVTAVIDLGSRSVRVLMVEGTQLVEMRALRIGDTSVVEDLARRNGIGMDAAREAMLACTATGGDHTVTVEEALPAATGEAVEGAPPAAPRTREVTVTRKEVEAAQAAFLQRLSREIVRHLTSTGRASRIDKLWITGGMCRMAGVTAMLKEVFGIDPQELDLLGKLHHELDPEVAQQLGPRLATAIGLALAKFGGPSGFNLRQEDLAFTRGFERIKFPLAITCMIGLLALFVYGNKRLTEHKLLELQIGKTFQDPKNPKALPEFHGMTNSALAGKWFENPLHFRYEQTKGKDYTHKDLIADLQLAPVHKRIQLIKDKLKLVADQKQKDSGVYEDVTLESGLAVLVRFSQVMKSIEPQLGRYLVTKIDLSMKSPSRRLVFVIAFRESEFREKIGVVTTAFEAEYGKPDSPFEKPKRDERPKESLFKDSADKGVSGAYWTVSLDIKDSFEAFGPSAPRAVGALDRGPRDEDRVLAKGKEGK